VGNLARVEDRVVDAAPLTSLHGTDLGGVGPTSRAAATIRAARLLAATDHTPSIASRSA
jgi:Ni,Fe-hydrogenase III large subunit